MALNVVAPAEGAVRPFGRVIDYFPVSAIFGEAVAKPAHGWDLSPRFPVELRIHGAAIDATVQIVACPGKLPFPLPLACRIEDRAPAYKTNARACCDAGHRLLARQVERVLCTGRIGSCPTSLA